ncbi:MAG: hypothetical protein QOG69_2426 [Actinomycetota bacterium]|nr:hypothetical protein [Actinomycetota bacterium]
MDLATRFDRIEGLLRAPIPPSWPELGSLLALPDGRWHDHDPAAAVASLASSWQRGAIDWAGVSALWLGIESDGGASSLDPVGYSALGDTGFPHRAVWHADRLPSKDLTAFATYYGGDARLDGYDYWAPLAWTGLIVRLLAPAPAGVTVLAGFSGGDWFMFPAAV